MSAAAVLRELEGLGTEQTRKTYRRHGVRGAQYGVNYAPLGKLAKRLKTDHALAGELWTSGNHDARILATMIADPAATTVAELDRWIRDVDNYVLADALAGLASRTPVARKKMEKWTRSTHEWVGRIGWGILARLAMTDSTLTDGDYERYLEEIEKRIHGSKNRIRDAMNMAVIAIGLRSAAFEKKAVGAAKRIGKVEVDHGETGCKTPDAVEYIGKAKR
ncbi:MAG: DNA alkylation repair protein [Acidobacteriota bacterium]|nr:DNA alkylation repair protein [Acidobacteriota bacterium]MDQ5870583.1 DNA alkylation repair protein [Acidobacteriota bacterium]